ncbi:MAG: hypothetical protein P9L92_13775 [Candidatus Electryonea clarkiae]|nr:hypothetical protein [Candidatus Electryonea clarkiae]MDP8287678.1 hypothetical protein [Candidatus Electryonea clarkiae]
MSHSKQIDIVQIIAVAASLFFMNCTENNPIQVDEDPWGEQRGFYPLNLGSEWIYTVGSSQDFIYTVISHKELQFGDSAIIKEDGPAGTFHAMAYWDFNKLYVSYPDTSVPIVYLQLPLEVGRSWTALDSAGFRYESQIIAVDSMITVPSGTFTNTVVIKEIQYYINSNSDDDPDTVWTAYAKNVGNIFFKTSGGYISELKSFSIGDD